MGAIFHPAVTLLNAGRIESTKEDFKFYIEGLTPSVGKVLEILDAERVNVASSLGIRAQTAVEWLKMAYNTTGVDLWEAIHKQTGYYEVKAPRSLQHRYLFEEVPMGLVPIASLGRNNGVSVSGISSVIQLACMIDKADYWSCGRTLEKLGLTKLSVTELTRYVNEGELGRL
jgi:opine dehydrogenase